MRCAGPAVVDSTDMARVRGLPRGQRKDSLRAKKWRAVRSCGTRGYTNFLNALKKGEPDPSIRSARGASRGDSIYMLRARRGLLPEFPGATVTGISAFTNQSHHPTKNKA
jgi:hypothetical protein